MERLGLKIKRLLEMQKLEASIYITVDTMKYLKKGGTLIYSTCSINPNENRKVCDWFLKENKEFETVKVAPDIERCIDEGDYLTLTPHINNCDGFFIAKFKRK